MDALGRILVVDDEEPVREVLTEYFGAQGYAVEAVASGADALAAVKRGRPDLVLLDVRMPGIDGVETLRRLRGLDGGVAVIMVTANEDVGLARETLKIGAFDYVAKPFDFSYLDRAVAAALVRAGGPPGVVPRRLLMTIAADLGDLAAAERATMEAAVATARRSAPPTR